MTSAGTTPTYRQDELFVDAAVPVLAGVYELAGEHEVHAHDFCEIAVIAGGTGCHVTSAGTRPVDVGEVFVLRPGAWHGFSQCADLVVANACLSGVALARDIAFLRELPALRELLWTGPLATGQHGVLEHWAGAERALAAAEQIRTLHHDLDAEPTNRTLLLGRLLTVLGNLIQPGQATTPAMDLPAPVRRIVERLEIEPEHQWRLEEMAKSVNLDPAHVSRLFSRHLGLPPIAYLARLRAERAAGLLARSDLPVAQVGALVGWPDPTYFARRFRLFHGVSPTKYRQRSQHGGVKTHPSADS